MSSSSAPTWTIPRSTNGGVRRLSFPQERLFLLDRLMPGLPAYNVPMLVKVGCTLDAELLRQAFETIVERHQILRTTIRLIDGVPVQEIAPAQPFELAIADLRPWPAPAEREAEADRLLGALVQRPFDLSSDVLLRAALVHLSEGVDLLLTVFHHIGSDHASSALLFAELDALYTALAKGETPELPELPIQYSDFAQWQREQLGGDLEVELLEYWRERLAGAPERLELPTDRPRPNAQSYRGRLHEHTFEPGIVGPLRELARGEGVSLFMVLLAAFKTMLHRYTGAEDLVVGAPVSGRHHEEIASLLGYFSNTLVLRTDLSGNPTFAELLARVKATTLEAQVYQELPFERLVEVLNPQRARSHSPLFQVLLGFDVALEPPALAGQPLQRLPVPGWEWSRFDLSIVLRDTRDGSLHAQVEYATELFDERTIERLLGHLETLLRALPSASGRRISELPILAEPESRRLLDDWNSTSRGYDRRCLHELFAEQAARTPDAIAVYDGAERITYAALERRSNQLARHLQQLGVGPQTLVGVCVERSVDLIIALLGALKTGAAYVPIEPTYPPQRQEFMLADAGAQVLITQERFLGAVDPRAATVVCLDASRVRELIGALPDTALGIPSDPEQLAYVIYTSGSTGQPKGVEIRHRSVANLLAHMCEAPGICERDVVANLTTPAFDLSVPDWFLPLNSGARLVIVPREATLDGVDLADWLARSAATFVQATPTTWQLLVDAGWKGSPALKIVCGGEALPRALADQLLERGASLWHMYGPTETTVWSSILELSHHDGPPPLGGPIANTSFYVLDWAHRAVPIGVPGELYIGGAGVARGYHDRPELSAEKFVENPFVPADSGRLYRTGDLVRWREGGTLEFLGRIDQQVKLRGFRLELEEIEAALDAHPDVRASVAIVREDVPGDQRLVAYVVPNPGARLDTDDLRRLLKRELPPFMVPSAFVALAALPLSANGKLDRAALPAPDGARPELSRSYAPPETAVQETLASVWCTVLGIDRVGIDDDFFDLGGHSLLAVKMLARVNDTLGLDLYLGRVFDHPTIRELSVAITAQVMGEADDAVLAALLSEIEASER